MNKNSNLFPIITLLLLAPICGELVSSSAPPAEFFTPFGFSSLTLLYGCGALLVREYARRWGKGWGAVFLLGMAYGIYEEGILVRSFFDPGWHDLGVLATYGRWLGVNWVWAIALTIYHAVVSTTIPIMLAEMLHPAQRNQLWLGKAGLWLAWLGLLSVLIIAPLMSAYFNPITLGGCVLAIVWLARRAKNLPETPHLQPQPANAGVWQVFGIGLVGGLGYLLLNWILPGMGTPVLLTLAYGLFYPLGMAAWLRHLRLPEWSPRQQWAFTSGVMSLWMLVGGMAELDHARPDDTSGMALVALSFALFLFWVRRRMSKLEALPGSLLTAGS